MIRHVAFATLLLVSATGLGWAASTASPVGTWRTFDDVDGKESGAVEIVEANGMLYGRVTRIADPTKAAAVCIACTDDRKDQPVLGLQVIRGLKRDGDVWSGGEILDPKTGKIYKVKMHLEDDGQKLRVRGFIGLSLFGRSQTWVRG